MKKLTVFLCILLILSMLPVSAATYPSAFWKLNDAYNAGIANGDDAAVRDNARAIVKLFEGRWDEAAVSILSSRYMELGNALERLGDYEGACEAFEKSVPYFEKYPELGLGDPTESLEIINTKIQLFTPSLDLYRTYYGYQTYFGAINEKRMGLYWGLTANGEFRPYTPNESMVLIYQEFGTPDSGWNARLLKEAERDGLAVEFALNLPREGAQLAEVLQSKDYIMDVIKLLNSVDVPIFLRFGAEMDTWPVKADPTAFIAAFRYVADLVHEHTDHVAMVWSPTGVSPWLVDVNDYYPGDEYTDWIGVSLYLGKYFLGRDNWSRQEQLTIPTCFYGGDAADPVRMIEGLIDTYGDRKPFIISESGASHTYRTLNGVSLNKDETAWAINRLRMLYKYLPMAYPQIKAIAHFDQVMLVEACDYALSTNDALSSEYLNLVRDDAFIQNSFNDEANATYQKLSDWFSVEQGWTEFRTMAFYYAKDNVTVTYLIDGKQVASSSHLPYTASLDLSGYSIGNHTFTIRADANGKRLGEKSHTMAVEKAADIYINGARLELTQKPIIVEGTTLVPLRAVVEKLGGKVDWVDATRSIIITDGATEITLRIGSYDMIKNGVTSTLLVPARLINSTTYIPLRAVAEAMGAEIGWDGATKKITINK